MLFAALSDYHKYDTLRRSLRDALRNWLNLKSKDLKSFQKKKAEIECIITDIKTHVKKTAIDPDKVLCKSYSIGDRKHKGKRYSFDIAQIGKDFKGKVTIK